MIGTETFFIHRHKDFATRFAIDFEQCPAWLNEIGGFEARYTGWGNEDNDFSDRIRRSGRPRLNFARRGKALDHVDLPRISESYAARRRLPTQSRHAMSPCKVAIARGATSQ